MKGNMIFEISEKTVHFVDLLFVNGIWILSRKRRELPASWNMIKSQNIIKLSEVAGNKLSGERMTSC